MSEKDTRRIYTFDALLSELFMFIIHLELFLHINTDVHIRSEGHIYSEITQNDLHFLQWISSDVTLTVKVTIIVMVALTVMFTLTDESSFRLWAFL